MSPRDRSTELRFKISPELFNKVQELEKLGEFDSISGAARFILSVCVDGILSRTKMMANGEALPPTQPSSPPPQNLPEPTQQVLSPPSQPTSPVGGFGNSFSAIKGKVAS